MNTLEFFSFVNLSPLNEQFECMVNAEYLPGDPDTGIADDWDLIVTVDGVDVSYDITETDRLRLINEAIDRFNALVEDLLIDRYNDSLEY